MISIEGTWHSRYEYSQGANNGPQWSEHRIKFTQEGDVWLGRSLQGTDGSDVTLTLQQQGLEFSGTWMEHTAPSGHYKGRMFNGLIMLLLQSEGTELNGQWLGASSGLEQVKSGAWTLKRALSDE